jgi:DNA-binding response OmpR family regulator
MNGYEVCRKVRKTSSLKHTKIIMVTAKAMESEQLEGYQVGADDYLTKPFDGDELLEKVSFHLNQRSIEAASTDM